MRCVPSQFLNIPLIASWMLSVASIGSQVDVDPVKTLKRMTFLSMISEHTGVKIHHKLISRFERPAYQLVIAVHEFYLH